jgi:hypothetical protein
MAKAADSIQDILDSMKERFTNPLVFAFMASWVGWNWRVVVALLWTDSGSDVRSTTEVIEYISRNIQPGHGFWCPFASALLLVVILPLVKIGLQILYAYMNRMGTRVVLKIKAEGSISVRRYLSMRDDYTKRTERLVTLIEQEEETAEKLREATTEVTELRSKNVDLQNSETQARTELGNKDRMMRRAFDLAGIGGNWKSEYVNGNVHGEEFIEITGDKYFIISMSGGNPSSKQQMFKIISFHYDERKGEVCFVKELIDAQKNIRPKDHHFSVNILKFSEDGTTLTGTENTTTKIQYTRVNF